MGSGDSLATLYSGGRSRRKRAVLGIVDQLQDQVTAVFRHLVDQRAGNEARRLGDAEADMRSAVASRLAEKLLVFLGREIRG